MQKPGKNRAGLIDRVIEKLADETTAKVYGDIHDRTLAAYGVGRLPLEQLFLVYQSADLKKFCDDVTISRKEFSESVFACEMRLLPWHHRLSHRQFVPEHLHLTEEDRRKMSEAKVGGPLPKGFRKIMATFEERRMLVGHLFTHDDPGLWHLIYFDQRDISADQNHWVEGSHLHLLNWLTHPKQTASEVWKYFHEGNPKMGGKLSIKCAFKD